MQFRCFSIFTELYSCQHNQIPKRNKTLYPLAVTRRSSTDPASTNFLSLVAAMLDISYPRRHAAVPEVRPHCRWVSTAFLSMLSDTPLCGGTTFCLSLCPLTGLGLL